MATQEERKLELERKKQRLAEIREEKKRREEEKRQKLLSHQLGSDGDAGTPASSKMPTDEEMEKILTEVGIEATPKTSPPRDLDLTASASPAHISKSLFSNKTLVKSEVTQINFPPKEQVSYSKTTQTSESVGGEREFVGGMSAEWWEEDPLGGGVPLSPEEVFELDGSPTRHLAGLLPHISLVKPAEVPGDHKEEVKEDPQLADLTEEEKLGILASGEFQHFFDKSTRILERALAEPDDIFKDYSAGPDEDADKLDSGALLKVARLFADDKWSKGRCVSSLDYSMQYPELMAAGYHDNAGNPHEPAGVVLVWNSKFKKDTPEFSFHCQSRVTSVQFAKFHPNLILGGTYSGQICLWDNRQNRKTPVQRSPLSTSAHTHPVYAINVVGTQNAHNLISVSTDGRMCAWSLDMLAEPQEILDLQWKQSRAVAAMCMSFPMHDVNNFLVGSEEGGVYLGCRHGTKAGILEAFEGHFAPVTGVACHAAMGSADFSQHFLSSSFDWSVKLWNIKESRPLLSFEDHSDYVLDVAWSPVHPAVFACVDATGRLELWNLNQDTELPAAVATIQGLPGLSKLLWMQNGQQVAVGDSVGNVWLYDVCEGLGSPRSDEWQRLSKTFLDVKAEQLEAEELTQAMALTSPAR